MAKLTLEDLRRMRGEKQKAMEMRDSSNKDVQVIVGMGTCGIAAGLAANGRRVSHSSRCQSTACRGSCPR